MYGKIQKYRPVFTLGQLKHISNLCKQNPAGISQIDAEIIGILASFIAKAENAAITPAYSMQPKMTLEESLGFAPLKSTEQAITRDRMEYAAYEKYSTNPASCSIDEINMALQYKYENDLMSAEEASKYEKTLMEGVFHQIK